MKYVNTFIGSANCAGPSSSELLTADPPGMGDNMSCSSERSELLQGGSHVTLGISHSVIPDLAKVILKREFHSF